MLPSTSKRAFKEAGFDEEQAEALSEMMTDIFTEFATKSDLEREVARLDHRIELSAAELRGEMAAMRQEVNGQISSLRNELKSAFEKELKEQTRWFIALVGLIGTILVISNLLSA